MGTVGDVWEADCKNALSRPDLACFKCLDDIHFERIQLASFDVTSTPSGSQPTPLEKNEQRTERPKSQDRKATSAAGGSSSALEDCVYPDKVPLLLMTGALMMSVFVVALDANIIGQPSQENVKMEAYGLICLQARHFLELPRSFTVSMMWAGMVRHTC